MDVSRALDQIAEIHEQIAKGEVYRGYRSLPVAASGLIGLAAAWLQPAALGRGSDRLRVLLDRHRGLRPASSARARSSTTTSSTTRRSARRQTRRVVGQFLPSLVGGAIVTACFMHLSAALVPLLPGLWAFCFGLGILRVAAVSAERERLGCAVLLRGRFVLLWIGAGPEPLTGMVGGDVSASGSSGRLVLYGTSSGSRNMTEATDKRARRSEIASMGLDWPFRLQAEGAGSRTS